jgi:hypothetical protein
VQDVGVVVTLPTGDTVRGGSWELIIDSTEATTWRCAFAVRFQHSLPRYRYSGTSVWSRGGPVSHLGCEMPRGCVVRGGLKEKRGTATYCNDLSSLELLASWTQRDIVSNTVSPRFLRQVSMPSQPRHARWG